MKYKNATIHRDDFETFKEYNKIRMRIYNQRKHVKQRFDRYKELIAVIREMEKDGYDDDHIADKLTKIYKYKLVLDRDMKGE